MATAYNNAKTRVITLNTHKSAMIKASELTENMTDFSYLTGYISIRHADLYNMMTLLPGNAFKLYLYLYCQKEGTSWSLHREKVCQVTGLSEKEYRTAVAKLVELGYLNIETATLEGIKPLTTEQLLKEVVPAVYNLESQEDNQDYNDWKENPHLRAVLPEYTKYLNRQRESYSGEVLPQPTEDVTYKSREAALLARAQLLEDYWSDVEP